MGGNEQEASEPSAELVAEYRDAEAWDDLAELLERQVEIVEDDEERRQLYDELSALYEQLERHRDLVRILEAQWTRSSDSLGRFEITMRMASIYERKLDDPRTAFARWLAAFELHWRSPTARFELQRLAQLTGSWGQVIEAYTRTCEGMEEQPEPVQQQLVPLATIAARTLETEIGDPEAAMDMYWRILAMRHTGSRAPILREMARLQADCMNSPADAFVTVREAVSEDPSDAHALALLEQLAAAQNVWPEVAALYRTVASRPSSVEQQVDIRCRLGRVYKDHLDEYDRALTTYERVLDLSPNQPEVINALVELYTRTERWGALVELIHDRGHWDRLIAILELYTPAEPSERAATFQKIAQLCEEQLGETERAIEVCRRALNVDPSCLPVLRLLHQLYERTERHAEQLDMMEMEVDATSDKAERIDVLLRMADLCENHIGDIERAAECAENSLIIDGNQQATYARLAGYYARLEQWEQLVECHQSRLELIEDVPLRVELLNEVARVCFEELDDIDGANDAYELINQLTEGPDD